VDNSAQLDLLNSLSGTVSEFQAGIGKLDKALSHHASGDAFDHAKHSATGLPAMAAWRHAGDKLETMVADDLCRCRRIERCSFISDEELASGGGR